MNCTFMSCIDNTGTFSYGPESPADLRLSVRKCGEKEEMGACANVAFLGIFLACRDGDNVTSHCILGLFCAF